MKHIKVFFCFLVVTVSAVGVQLLQELGSCTNKPHVDNQPDMALDTCVNSMLDLTYMQEMLQEKIYLEKYESCVNSNGNIGYHIPGLDKEHNQPKHNKLLYKKIIIFSEFKNNTLSHKKE